MAVKFPETAAGVPNAQPEFDRRKKSNMRAFVVDFIKKYNLTGLPSAGVSSITYGPLGTFVHLGLFLTWSDAICNNTKPPIEFLLDCLVRR